MPKKGAFEPRQTDIRGQRPGKLEAPGGIGWAAVGREAPDRSDERFYIARRNDLTDAAKKVVKLGPRICDSQNVPSGCKRSGQLGWENQISNVWVLRNDVQICQTQQLAEFVLRLNRKESDVAPAFSAPSQTLSFRS